MAIRNLTVWLRVRDIARFARDMRSAERRVDRFKDATERADKAGRSWGQALSAIGQHTNFVSRRTRIFGFAVSTVVSALTASVPLAVSFGGSLVSVASSASAAAAGLGLLGVTAGGVLAVGLGGLTGILANAQEGFKKVFDANRRARLAMFAYGRDSKQFETAQKRLNAAVREFGGPDMLAAVEMWEKLKKAWEDATGPAMRTVVRLFRDTIAAGEDLIPIIAEITNNSVRVLGAAWRNILDLLTGPEIAVGLQALGRSFEIIATPLARAMEYIFLGLFRIAVRLAPLLTPVARGIRDTADAFAQWAAKGDMSFLIENTRSWWELMKAVGRLLLAVFRGSVSQGESLVDALTGVVNKWADFLSTAEGHSAMIDFFKDSVRLTIEFTKTMSGVVAAIFNFGRHAEGLYTHVFRGIRAGWAELMEALAPAKPFFDNVLWPLIKGFALGIGASLFGALKLVIGIIRVFAVWLGAIGAKLGFLRGPLELVGKALGFLFGGPILSGLSKIGRLNALLGPMGKLFGLLLTPLRLAGGLLRALFVGLMRLGGAFAGFAARFLSRFTSGFGLMLRTVANFATRFFDAGASLGRHLMRGVVSVIAAALGAATDIVNALIGLINSAIPNSIPVPGPLPDIPLPDNPIPLLASGGVVSGTGSWITGEAGPELNTLRGGRVTVQPLTPATVAPSSDATLAPRERDIVVAKVYLRGRQIAEAVADEVEDEKARR